MTHLNYRFFCLITGIFFMSTATGAQTVNFNETWKEFLENNKISDMSVLARPDKTYDQRNYIKYSLMNTNSSFCQSRIEDAENWIAEIQDIDPSVHQAVPGFVMKMKDLESKIKAYHIIDAIWKRFLKNREVNLEELESIKAAKTLCEKRTLAKYSYMTAYSYYCRGDIERAKNIIQTRTLRLTEKTSLRVEDVEGLGPEVAKMKLLFQHMSKLQTNWKNYIETGVSPGFNMELPLFPCYPIPNMKEWVLKGAADVCTTGPLMLENIKKLQAQSGVILEGDLDEKVKDLEAAIEQNQTNLDVLNKAWADFVPDNELTDYPEYGYEYCRKEPLIRAYIMDGFTNVCGMAEDMLQKIDYLQQTERLNLDDITLTKINELAELFIQFQTNEVDIQELWVKFVEQGDTLYDDYYLADYYCDHVLDVKSWVIKGLSGTCEEGIEYLEQIDEVKRKFEFEFVNDVRCRVIKLRIKIWDCRHEALSKLARVQSEPETFDDRLAELMEEYGMGPRPEVCLEN